jgi:hypothetical protein
MDIEPAEDWPGFPTGSTSDHSFPKGVCTPLLREVQNSDGGWGFRPEGQSRVEPTCWAIKALTALAHADNADERIFRRGLDFLTRAQLADGSWSAAPGEKTGCWVTSLACWILIAMGDEKYAKAVAAGLRWVCDDWPRDSTWWRRSIRKLSAAGRYAKQNDVYRGWAWTPGTSSWVEPTAFALLALESQDLVGGDLNAPAAKRRRLGEALLYDRMCPGGGWNCGNPEVYGVPGEALVIPTTWALLALRHHPDRRENKESLAWMENNFTKIRGQASYALARICLAVYDRQYEMRAANADDDRDSVRSVQVLAWMSLAAGNPRQWLTAGTSL